MLLRSNEQWTTATGSGYCPQMYKSWPGVDFWTNRRHRERQRESPVPIYSLFPHLAFRGQRHAGPQFLRIGRPRTSMVCVVASQFLQLNCDWEGSRQDTSLSQGVEWAWIWPACGGGREKACLCRTTGIYFIAYYKQELSKGCHATIGSAAQGQRDGRSLDLESMGAGWLPNYY
jgi:hypothetical protein